MSDETELEAVIQETDQTAAEEPADPYFVRDGKAYTGEGDPVPVEAEADAEPDNDNAQVDNDNADERSDKERLDAAFISLKKQKKRTAQRERELDRLSAELNEKLAQFNRVQELYKENPYGAAKELGLDFRHIVESVAKEQDEDPTQAALAEIRKENAELRDALNAIKAEREQQSAVQVTQNEINMLKERVEGAAEDLPHLNAYGADRAAQAVHSAWYAHYKATGEKLEVSELFAQYEQELRDDYERLARIKQPAEVKASPKRRNGAVQSAKTGAHEEAPSTLSNRTAAQRASADRALTREERMQLAAQKLQAL